MLTDRKTLLDIAEEKGCAIPAFNVYNAETALGAIFAAEEANSCVILQMYSRLFSNFEAQFMAPSILEAARNAKVKVAFHLDHGANDEVVTKALRWGCTGVMRDASTSPFEENVAILKNVVERAHAVGVSVEGELGHIGVAKDGVSTEYTKVDEAKKFVDETGVDALAIMVGTAHGHYKQAPVLAIDRIAEIHAATKAGAARRQRRAGRSDSGCREGRYPQDQLRHRRVLRVPGRSSPHQPRSAGRGPVHEGAHPEREAFLPEQDRAAGSGGLQ